MKRIALLPLASLALAACGSDGPMGTTPVSVASVAVTPDSAKLTALGSMTLFEAVAKDAAGKTISGKTFSWASTATDVATVNPTLGLATAAGNGTTTIRATTDGVSGTASLTVAALPLPPSFSYMDGNVVTNPDLNGNTFTFTWGNLQTARAFLVEIGHQPGASDVAVIEVDQPPLTWEAPGRGVDVDYYVRVRGKNEVGIGPPSDELGFHSLDVRDFIEALFLSDGPLTLGEPSGFMDGFPVGSQITVRFLNTINPGLFGGLTLLTGVCDETPPGFGSESAIPCAMDLSFIYLETSDRERMEDALQGGERPPKNEVWVYDTDEGCPGASSTHRYYEAGSPVTWAAIICVSNDRNYVASHEMGHALGFHELAPHLGEKIGVHMMLHGSDECLLSEYEFAAVELVYAAGLRPGDRRQDFINAGLIEP